MIESAFARANFLEDWLCRHPAVRAYFASSLRHYQPGMAQDGPDSQIVRLGEDMEFKERHRVLDYSGRNYMQGGGQVVTGLETGFTSRRESQTLKKWFEQGRRAVWLCHVQLGWERLSNSLLAPGVYVHRVEPDDCNWREFGQYRLWMLKDMDRIMDFPVTRWMDYCSERDWLVDADGPILDLVKRERSRD